MYLYNNRYFRVLNTNAHSVPLSKLTALLICKSISHSLRISPKLKSVIYVDQVVVFIPQADLISILDLIFPADRVFL